MNSTSRLRGIARKYGNWPYRRLTRRGGAASAVQATCREPQAPCGAGLSFRSTGRGYQMAIITLEDRVSILETEVARLKEQLAAEKPQNAPPWWEWIYGTFANSP